MRGKEQEQRRLEAGLRAALALLDADEETIASLTARAEAEEDERTIEDGLRGKADDDEEAGDGEDDGTSPGRRRRKRRDDFIAYLPTHNYIYKPTLQPWPGGSIDSVLPKVKVGKDKDGKTIEIRASQWIDQNNAVDMMTWAPGMPMLIHDQLVVDGGWIDKRGDTTFNLYRPPVIKPGDASKADRWVAHVRRIYPDNADHIVKWFASKI